MAPHRLGSRRHRGPRPRRARHRRSRERRHHRRDPRRPQDEHQGDRRPGRQGPRAVHEGMRRDPEEGLRRLQRAPRHRRHHRLHGEAGRAEGQHAQDRQAERRLRRPDRLRPLRHPVRLRPDRRGRLQRLRRDGRHRRRLRRPQRRGRPGHLPRTYGLSACTTANGCFKKVSQTGSTTSLPTADSGWAGEISLDLDMVSATCPNCNILLVEATSASDANLGTAVNEAVKLGAKFVSNSYGGSESSSDTTYDSSYYNHPGVAITASAGDSGLRRRVPGRVQVRDRGRRHRPQDLLQQPRLDRERLEHQQHRGHRLRLLRRTTPSPPGRPTPAAPSA